MRCVRWVVAVAILAIAGSASVPVQAQFFFWDQQYQYKRNKPQSGGFFNNWFGGGQYNSRPEHPRRRDDDYAPPAQRQYQQHTQQPSESSRAPAPRKSEAKGEQIAPTTSVVVMGDDMADWLAYGLEDVFADSPEVRILRKNKLGSGLQHYDSKGDLDWWHVARDTLAQEKTDYIVMMLGLSDRGDIREKDIAKEAETRAKEQQAKDQVKDQTKDQTKDQSKDEAEKKSSQKSVKTDNGTETDQRSRKTGGSAGFQSDEWEKVYSRRIDDTIAALKSKGVPVIWVGLPSIRGTRASGDAAYLNELYRSRAERAGITYIDVWDGFVDEAGKYSNYGPDYEGQVRRLRLSDGVFFTKAGAIKLARYVEHELSRYMSNRTPVALPSGPVEPSPSEAKPAERPLMGPVVPLTGKPTGTPKDSDELLGAPGSNPIHGDALATKVLAKGETMPAPTGRADNFAWRPNTASASQSGPVAAVTAEPKAEAKIESQGSSPVGTSALASAPTDMKQEEQKKGAGKPAYRTTKKTKQEVSASSSGSGSTSSSTSTSTSKPPRDGIPRPPKPIDASNGSWNGSHGLFNWWR